MKEAALFYCTYGFSHRIYIPTAGGAYPVTKVTGTAKNPFPQGEERGQKLFSSILIRYTGGRITTAVDQVLECPHWELFSKGFGAWFKRVRVQMKMNG
jgi:hypothetical protein